MPKDAIWPYERTRNVSAFNGELFRGSPFKLVHHISRLYNYLFENSRRACREIRGCFQKVKRSRPQLKPSKCEFFKSQITYLGHIISSENIATDLKKIKAIQLWPRPETVTQVRKFKGLTNYYRKFIHNYAKVAKPLHQLVSGENTKLKRTTVKWTEECE